MELIFAFFANNWFIFIYALLKFFYNVYSFINKNYLLHLMIGEHKENQNAAGKISFINKIKFIFYFLGSIISLIFVFLELFDYLSIGNNKRKNRKTSKDGLLSSFRLMWIMTSCKYINLNNINNNLSISLQKKFANYVK